MPRSFTLLAACAVALLVVSGCDPDQPDPNYSSVTPAPSSSTGPTPTDTPIAPNTTANVPPGVPAPTLPNSGKSHTPDGALAFAAYFWRMLDWAYATNDAAVIDGLFATSCRSCATFRTTIATDVAAGYTLVGGRIAIKSVQTASLTGGKVPAELAVDVMLSVEALKETTTSGSVATSYPATTNTQRTYLSWVDAKWTVVNTAQVQS